MRDASLYVDDFFYFNKNYWVNLEAVDRIHDPGAVYAYGSEGIMHNMRLTAGTLVDAYA